MLVSPVQTEMKSAGIKIFGFFTLSWTKSQVILNHEAVQNAFHSFENLYVTNPECLLDTNDEWNSLFQMLKFASPNKKIEILQVQAENLRGKLKQLMEDKQSQRQYEHQGQLLERWDHAIFHMQQTFGRFVEFVLHDVRDYPKNTKTIYRIYGHVTGRKVGDTMTNYGDKILKDGTTHEANYYSKWKEKKIKSTTIVLKDEIDISYGMLCINMDITELEEDKHYIVDQLKYAQRLEHEKFYGNITQQVYAMIEEYDNWEDQKKFGEHMLNHLIDDTPLFREPFCNFAIPEVAKQRGIPETDLRRMLKSRGIS